jgi:hypothetical protein
MKYAWHQFLNATAPHTYVKELSPPCHTHPGIAADPAATSTLPDTHQSSLKLAQNVVISVK